MVRDTRPMTITYKTQSSTFDMPGWYCDGSGESIHIAQDIKVSDTAVKELKIKVENLGSRSPPASVDAADSLGLACVTDE
jgi:HTH-type transcriptional regulator / antitoxin MqsA